MNYVTLLLRAGLALMFATAAAGKFMDLRTSRATIEAFGVPKRLARSAGTLLPVAESACAIALLINPAARIGAIASALLIAIFSGGIVYALRGGRAPQCNCFGQISSAPISSRLLIRNVIIFAVACVVVFTAPGASLSSWTTNTSAAAITASAAVLIACGLSIALFNALRRAARLVEPTANGEPDHAELLAQAAADPDSPIGKPAPDFELLDWDLQPRGLQTMLAAGKPVVLVFAGMDCEPCTELIPELARWSQALSDQITIGVIESGQPDPHELHQVVSDPGSLVLLCEPGRLVAEAYGAWGTPVAFAIDADGVVIAGPAPGSGSVEAVIRMTLNQTTTTPAGV